ncbi:SAV_2336 N-terminal domain-related protein [Streptomyces huiliensis]|uniref:SAV_2336 N-terminal domain-related protein n=1 Tax=Streptomyces huiliensis TaxID=2876027 RepID=UPI001CBD020C|nr:SAV_2336 N-terminal domain-related protein [Streptomyces huiliensis]MBZ4322739.1 tetratricopeptide repeat protein [Streptomyces huiliensis]
MTAPPEPWLEELVGRLRATSQDLTAEEIADAVWLAERMSPDAGARTSPGDDSEPATVETAHVKIGRPFALMDREREAGAPAATGGEPAPGDPVTVCAGARDGRDARENAAAGGRWAGAARAADTVERTFPVRVPSAASLPGLLGLQRALRPLRGYRSLAAPPRGPLDEDATADRAARTGLVHPAYRPGERQAASMQLLMDTSSSMVVWERMLDEMEQLCSQLGVFRDVRVRYLHRASDGTPLIATSAAGGAVGTSRQRPRPADQFLDPSGRRLTLVISDCVGPMWQEGRAQRLLHRWSATAPLAVVQPLPPRLWPRTALPAEAGTLTRGPMSGGRLGFEPDAFGPPPPPGALPVPVLLPVREALGAWARLLSGTGRTTVHGAAGWVLPEHPATAPPPQEEGAAPTADARLAAFRASASPGALRLAVHLAAVPLALPVMQVVQRAMLPDTGPMELAEVLLGGLLHRVPAPTGADAVTGPWYEFADGVRELLLQSLGVDEATLVLKHCSDYVERHFGRTARNFSALAVARLRGHPVPDTGADDPDSAGSADSEPELFARVPARVVRWYRPTPPETGPVGEAAGLLRLWHDQGDSALLHEARELVTAPAAAPLAGLTGDGRDEAVRARFVLGGVLLALAGTEAVRDDAAGRRELLDRSVALLAEAHAHTPPGTGERTAAGTDAHTATGLELAAAHWARWRADGDRADRADLRAAEAVLRALPPRTDRRLRLGRVLLALAESGAESRIPRATEAAVELRAACELLESEDAPDGRRCAALLDLGRALRLAGEPADATLAVLDRAAETAADELQSLYAHLERARVHAGAGDGPRGDEAYTAAVALTGRDSPRRCSLLTEWGEWLLGRAEAAGPTGDAGTVSRAEAVLREAYAVSPGRSPRRPRLQLLLGRALMLRFGRLGFLPDLYESCHLLEQAARRAPDGSTRAEAWLELGTARLALRERSPGLPLTDAADAFAAAAEQARRSAGDEPGSVVAARASHRYGEALERMGLRRQALAAYRAAAGEWRDLTARLAEVPWDEVAATRESVARLSGG